MMEKDREMRIIVRVNWREKLSDPCENIQGMVRMNLLEQFVGFCVSFDGMVREG